MNITIVMLFWCSSNTQSFKHHKSSSHSQLFKGKSRNLEKLLTCLNWMANSAFRKDTGSALVGQCFLDFQLVESDCFFSICFCFMSKWFTLWSIIINSIGFVSIIYLANFLMLLDNCHYILTDYT